MPIITYGIIIVTAIISFFGFNNRVLYEKNLFSIESVLVKKQFYRLITSQFFHANWPHLLFNLFSFYSFAINIELTYGIPILLLLYVVSGIGGDLLTLFLKRNDLTYRAVGASGAVCGVIFSSIFLIPGGSIFIFPIPVPIPTWLFAILFIMGTMYGIGRQKSDIGHEAHLGGAITGILLSLVIFPKILYNNYMLLIGVLVPVIIFLILYVNVLDRK